MSIALVPGSYDPITVGHCQLIRRAAQMYDVVYVALLVNPDKRYLLSPAQRKMLVELAVADMPNVRVVASRGMTWRLARRLHANCLVRGVRNQRDIDYEQIMADYNKEHGGIETVLLHTDSDVSSTAVREALLQGMRVDGMVPSSCVAWLHGRFGIQ